MSEAMDWTLPDGLPPGRMIVPDPYFAEEDPVTEPVLWVSSEPTAAAGPLWARLLAHHRDLGLWPLLLMGRPARRTHPFPERARREAGRPWHSAELAPEPVARIGAVDVARTLAEWWDITTGEGQPGLHLGDRPATPPRSWPGLAPAGPPGPDPDQRAASLVTMPGVIPALTGFEEDPYLGLARGADGAAAIVSCGWMSRAGGLPETAAIVRSWQDRFGARVCSLGLDTMGLLIARPPVTREHARRVAAEHFAFCVDLARMVPLDEHASKLIGAPVWHFWWD